MQLFRLECKRLLAGYVNKLVLLLFLLTGVLAIYQGAQGYKSLRIDQYKSAIVFQKEKEHVKTRDSLPEAGALAYYASAPTEWKLSPWAALFVGQSQTSMVAMKIQALALQGQVYDREIVNPSQQRAGGLDLGFVFVHLLPLVIGVLTVALVSDEQHAGRWRLLNALPKGALNLLFRQLRLRFILMWLLSGILLLTAALILKLPFDTSFWVVLGALTLYILFWFLVAALIISLGKNSVFNNLSYLCVWVIVAILTPGFIHLYLSHSFKSDAPLEASLTQRMVFNDGWDTENKQNALDEFLRHEPRWQDTQPLTDAFHWKWYYAQQHLSDLAAQQYWQEHLEDTRARQARLQLLSVLSPSLYFQLTLHQIAGTDSVHYLHYLEQLHNYHQELRHFFYDFMFYDKAVSLSDVDDFPNFQAEAMENPSHFGWLAFSMIVVSIFGYFVTYRLKRISLC